jgi:hypothetical protein
LTRFRREGFFRTSPLGKVHWVTGHDVERHDWDISMLTERNEPALRLARAHEGETARLVRPNADCPVCGAPVFFYQNAAGSRVYFDELGPPWPKHPCTVQLPRPSAGGKDVTLDVRALRTQEEYDRIQEWCGGHKLSNFESRYGAPRWDLAAFVAVYESHDICIIVVNTANGYRYFASAQFDSLSVIDGQLLTCSGNRLSYISPSDLKVTELTLRRIGPRRALHHILDIERLSPLDGDRTD